MFLWIEMELCDGFTVDVDTDLGLRFEKKKVIFFFFCDCNVMPINLNSTTIRFASLFWNLMADK